MGFVDIIISVSIVAAIIIGVLVVLFGFGFIADTIGEIFSKSDTSGDAFFTVAWIIVTIIVILLIAVVVKFIFG